MRADSSMYPQLDAARVEAADDRELATTLAAIELDILSLLRLQHTVEDTHRSALDFALVRDEIERRRTNVQTR